MAVFSRILKNLGATITGRAVTIVQQVIVAPVFVSRYSLAQFGEWGVLSGAVAAIGLLDFGVQTYMNQDLAVRYGRGDTSSYHVHQSTALRILLGVILTASILSLVPTHNFGHLPKFTEVRTRKRSLFMTLSRPGTKS